MQQFGSDRPSSRRTLIITLIGRSNAGKSSIANAIAGRHVASVSQQAGHTQRVQSITVAPGLVIRDSPPVDARSSPGEPHEWRVTAGMGVADATAAVKAAGVAAEAAPVAAAAATQGQTQGEIVGALCGLTRSAQIRSPYAAVRTLGECVDLCRLYAMQPNELAEAGEERDALSPVGLCCALAAKKGFRQTRSCGAPDPHRAGLLIIRDCAQGALPLASGIALAEELV